MPDSSLEHVRPLCQQIVNQFAKQAVRPGKPGACIKIRIVDMKSFMHEALSVLRSRGIDLSGCRFTVQNHQSICGLIQVWEQTERDFQQ